MRTRSIFSFFHLHVINVTIYNFNHGTGVKFSIHKYLVKFNIDLKKTLIKVYIGEALIKIQKFFKYSWYSTCKSNHSILGKWSIFP